MVGNAEIESQTCSRVAVCSSPEIFWHQGWCLFCSSFQETHFCLDRLSLLWAMTCLWGTPAHPFSSFSGAFSLLSFFSSCNYSFFQPQWLVTFSFVLAAPFNGVSIWADGCTFLRGARGPQPWWHWELGSEGVTADYGPCSVILMGKRAVVVQESWCSSLSGSLSCCPSQYHSARNSHLRINAPRTDLLCPCSVLPLHHLHGPLKPLPQNSVIVTEPVFFSLGSEDHQPRHTWGFLGKTDFQVRLPTPTRMWPWDAHFYPASLDRWM